MPQETQCYGGLDNTGSENGNDYAVEGSRLRVWGQGGLSK